MACNKLTDQPMRRIGVFVALLASIAGAPAHAVETIKGATTARQATAAAPKGTVKGAKEAAPPAAETVSAPAEIGAPISATIGKSTLIRLPEPVTRMSIGNPQVADITLISPREVYVLGKALGSTNLILWTRAGRTTIVDVSIGIDVAPLQAKLGQLLPTETDILVEAAAGSIVLSGTVSDAVKAGYAVSLAEAYVRDLNRSLILPVVAGETTVAPGTAVSVGGATTGGAVRSAVGDVGARVVNLLKVRDPQQVMIEVKVAEISKTLLDRLGVELNLSGSIFGSTWRILSTLFDPTTGGIVGFQGTDDFLRFHAQKDDGMVRLLAEPNIVTISGQEGSFLSGGKVFIPVERTVENGQLAFTLEEKEFGVGLKFTPTVLESGTINLKIAPEVSQVNSSGTPFLTTGGATSVLPSFTVRRASTVVQLRDGQTLAIAGLLQNNLNEVIRAIPVLGEIPILGALFRSADFQNDKSELVFLVTPRLAKPLPPNYKLPTDGLKEPSRVEFFLEGKLEGAPEAPPPGAQPAVPAPTAQPPVTAPEPNRGAGGFEMR
jgi:pilus assembly protein CpaC